MSRRQSARTTGCAINAPGVASVSPGLLAPLAIAVRYPEHKVLRASNSKLTSAFCLCHTGSCPNSCSSAGVCRPISWVATNEASGSVDASTAVTSFGVTYTNWEASSLYMCVCDDGRMGGDCSKRKLRSCQVCAPVSQPLPASRNLPSWRRSHDDVQP